jgi:hypothetical protein
VENKPLHFQKESCAFKREREVCYLFNPHSYVRSNHVGTIQSTPRFDVVGSSAPHIMGRAFHDKTDRTMQQVIHGG